MNVDTLSSSYDIRMTPLCDFLRNFTKTLIFAGAAALPKMTPRSGEKTQAIGALGERNKFSKISYKAQNRHWASIISKSVSQAQLSADN
ncbi:MAG TPA: hypothetical protein V6C97_05910 [Oculatellaceae cyanobacterium]